MSSFKKAHSDFLVTSTQKQRAVRSANSFVFGLVSGTSIGLSQHHAHHIHIESPQFDKILRFFDNCHSYSKFLDEKHDLIHEELHLFAEKYLQDVSDRLTVRMGLFGLWNLTWKDTIQLYTVCAFELTLFSGQNRFCELFEERDLLLLERYEDLKYYYLFSSVFKEHVLVSLPLLKDIFATFDEQLSLRENDENENDEQHENENSEMNKSGERKKASENPLKGVEYVARFRFAHAETLLPLISLLGLFRDEKKLTHDWSENEFENRKWKVSEIAPFAGNVNFELFKCLDNNHRVRVLINEEEKLLDWCEGEVFCPLESFRKQFSQQLELDFDEMCQIEFAEQEEENKNEGIENLFELELIEAEKHANSGDFEKAYLTLKNILLNN